MGAGEEAPDAQKIQKHKLMLEALKNQLFFIPSWNIYRIDGHYNHGPLGCAFKNNVLAVWSQHFVLDEGMLQFHSPSIIPKAVLKASGHVDESDNLFSLELIDPSKSIHAYLRPELAQGIFINFKDLYDFNDNKLPFAVAEIGQVHQNESIPHKGFLCLYEFTSAEIVHFMDPVNKSHHKFSKVSETEIFMFPREDQVSDKQARKMRIGEAVSKGIVNDETLGYFIGSVFFFLTHLGIDKNCLRFRQHLVDEMAHYSSDCWDAEIKSPFYGWIGCVGISDRSTYDLRAHSSRGVPLVAHQRFPERREVEELVIAPVEDELSFFKGGQDLVRNALKSMDEEKAMKMKATLEAEGQAKFIVHPFDRVVIIDKKMVSISKEKKEAEERCFTPSVIGSSFVIERIIYCLYERFFHRRNSKRGGKELSAFLFFQNLAPIQCAVFTKESKDQQYEEAAKVAEVAEDISEKLTELGISQMIDKIGTHIGRKYAKTDEMGIPLAITVDSTSSVTIRGRDSMDMVSVDVKKAVEFVEDIIIKGMLWSDTVLECHARRL